MTFREPATELEHDLKSAVPVIDEESTGEALLVETETADEPRPIPEETYEPAPSKGEDPVRLYLKEIGKVALLTARQEVEIGQRIEAGQIRLRRALVGIPMAVRALSDIGDRLRRNQIDP